MRKAKPTKHQWQQMDPQRTHNELREVWSIVTDYPGSSLRGIARKLDVSLRRSRLLVNLLLESGALIKDAGKHGTLRAPIPFITMRKEGQK